MDLACGMDPGTVTTTSPRIVAVQLPQIVTEQTSGFSLRPYALPAIWYIVLKAYLTSLQQGTQMPPVVINLSYGITNGPHDGTSLLERAIDNWVAAFRSVGWRVSLVLPAGNSQLTRCNAHARLPAGASKVVDWKVQPDDRTPSFCEIWMPCDAQKYDIEIEVTTPTGTSSGWLKENGAPWQFVVAGQAVGWLAYPGITSAGSLRLALFLLFPTADIAPGARTAPSGVYRIRMRNVSAQARTVNARIVRDDNAFDYPIFARQSYFEDRAYVGLDPAYQRYDSFGLPQDRDAGPSYVRRSGSINGIATGAWPIVIGGIRYTDVDRARYSAEGPGNRPQGCAAARRGPDAMAPSEHSLACAGLLAAGTRSGSSVALNGTSVAAPQVTRWLAEHMRLGGAGLALDVRNAAAALESGWVARVPPLAPPQLPPRQGGGRIVLPPGTLPPGNYRRPLPF